LIVLVLAISSTAFVSAASVSARPKKSATPAYELPGPFAAGVTTLDLPDRKVEVWYPAKKKAVKGAASDPYDVLTKVPPAIAALFPAGTDVAFETGAYRGIKASKKRPFPLVLMTHGEAGYREQLSYLATHLATWGFVVVSPDILERGIAAQLGSPPAVARDDIAVMRDAVALVLAANDTPGGPLAGRIRKDAIAVTGQSAGGSAAIRYASAEPNVVAYIPIAASSFTRATEGQLTLPSVPSMWITGAADQLVPVAAVESAFRRATIPTRFAAIGGAGNATVTDVCAIGGNGGLVGVADRANVPVPADLRQIITDGCQTDGAPYADVWAVVRHLVTAQLRSSFGIDRKPKGLTAAAAAKFAPLEVQFEEGKP
jgi:dienelactone hydrolase